MEPVLYWVQQLATQNQLDIWDYWELQAQIPVITRQFGLFFEQYDMLLTPNDPVLTPKAGVAAEYSAFDPLASLEDAEEHFERLVDVCRYCGPANQAGYPSLSLPLGKSKVCNWIPAFSRMGPGRIAAHFCQANRVGKA